MFVRPRGKDVAWFLFFLVAIIDVPEAPAAAIDRVLYGAHGNVAFC